MSQAGTAVGSRADGVASGAGLRGALLRDVPLGTVTRPSWRGRSHLIALVVAVPLLVTMLATVPAGNTRVGVAIYAAGLCSMLVASTTYHRWVHTLRWRAVWRRADHAMIYMAIAGTATPLCLVVLPPIAAFVTLGLLWSAAVVGATIKLFRWRRGDRLATAMYITNRWAGVVLIPAMAVHGFLWPTVLLSWAASCTPPAPSASLVTGRRCGPSCSRTTRSGTCAR